MKFRPLAACLILVAGLAGCRTSPKAQDAAAIESTAKADLYWLADDAREGRGPGTNGQLEAAAYIEKRFTDLGLKPLATVSDYEEEFAVPGRRIVGPKSMLSISVTDAANAEAFHTGRPEKMPPSTPSQPEVNKDFRPLPWGTNGSFTGKLAFVGYGINSKAYKYNDFEGVDLTGRVAVVFRYAPHSADGKSLLNKSDTFPAEAALALKGRAAKAAGAVGLLIVIPPSYHENDGALIPFGGSGGMGRGGAASIPVMTVTRDYAQKLLGPDHKLDDLQKSIDSTGKPASFLSDSAVSGETEVIEKPYDLKNVVAVLPGKGPNAGEYVVIGAHYDHVGRGEFGSRFPGQNKIHNGADDNASGTTALMGVARQLAALGPQDRTIIFVAFSGEEMGLLGSVWFVEHPPVPLDKIAYMLNLDMVGRLRNNMLYLGGTSTSDSMQRVADNAAAGTGLTLKTIGRGGFGPSDHQSFAEKKIPVLFFFTGLHAQYHGPDDDANLIDYQGISRIVTMAKKAAVALCQLPREKYVSAYDAEPIDLDSTDDSRPTPGTRPATRRAGRRTAALGVIPAIGSDDSVHGVAISGTMPDSPAAKAGLIDKDVLTKLGDKPIDNLNDLTLALRETPAGVDVVLHYSRDGKEQTATVQLTERPGPQ